MPEATAAAARAGLSKPTPSWITRMERSRQLSRAGWDSSVPFSAAELLLSLYALASQHEAEAANDPSTTLAISREYVALAQARPLGACTEYNFHEWSRRAANIARATGSAAILAGLDLPLEIACSVTVLAHTHGWTDLLAPTEREMHLFATRTDWTCRLPAFCWRHRYFYRNYAAAGMSIPDVVIQAEAVREDSDDEDEDEEEDDDEGETDSDSDCSLKISLLTLTG